MQQTIRGIINIEKTREKNTGNVHHSWMAGVKTCSDTKEHVRSKKGILIVNLIQRHFVGQFVLARKVSFLCSDETVRSLGQVAAIVVIEQTCIGERRF